MTATGSMAGPGGAAAGADVEWPPAFPGGTDRSSSALRGRQVRGWWAAIWLVFLLDAVPKLWHLSHRGERIPGLAALAGFALLYLVVFARVRLTLQGVQRPLSRVAVWLLLAGMAALATVVIWLIGQAGMGTLVYLTVVAVFALPPRQSLAVSALIIAVPIVVPGFVPGWMADFGQAFQAFLSALAMWGIRQLVLRNRQLAAAREEIARLAVADERNRFARDLHDLLGHSLTVVTVKAELAGRLLPADPARAQAEIADVERLAREALADVRAAVTGYREVSLAAELASARVALDAAGIEAELPTAVDDVPPGRRELFAWAVREGVTNVVRHSGARRCRVTVTAGTVEVVDDGRGPARGHEGGNGLRNLRERAEQEGGTVTVGRCTGGGFRLGVHMP